MLWFRLELRYQSQTATGCGVTVTRRTGLSTADVFVRWRRDSTTSSLAALSPGGAFARLDAPHHARDRFGAIRQRLAPFGSSDGRGYSKKARQCEVVVMAWQGHQSLGLPLGRRATHCLLCRQLPAVLPAQKSRAEIL